MAEQKTITLFSQVSLFQRLAFLKDFRYKKEAFVGLMLCALASASYLSYSWYCHHREKLAFKALHDCQQIMEKAFADNNLWTQVEVSCKIGYDQHRKTRLAPYFLLYQAESLIKQEKGDQALGLMNRALDELPKKSSVYPAYELKKILMQLDSADAKHHEKGLTSLQQMAEAKSNVQDAALYYLGRYYFSRNDFDSAQKAWKKLVEFPTKGQGASAYASLVQEKLEQIA